MNKYTGGYPSGGQKFGGKKSFGSNQKHGRGQQRDNRSGDDRSEKFSATCSECHKKCDVPFKPSADKPVYCSACFGMKKSGNELRGEQHNRPRQEHTSFGRTGKSSHSFDRIQVSERPPVKPGLTPDSVLELKRQISGLEVKLNRILDLINPPLPSAKVSVPEVGLSMAPTVPAALVPKVAAPKKASAKVTAKVAVKKTVAKVAKKAVAKKTAPKPAAKKTVTKAKKTTSKK